MRPDICNYFILSLQTWRVEARLSHLCSNSAGRCATYCRLIRQRRSGWWREDSENPSSLWFLVQRDPSAWFATQCKRNTGSKPSFQRCRGKIVPEITDAWTLIFIGVVCSFLGKRTSKPRSYDEIRGMGVGRIFSLYFHCVLDLAHRVHAEWPQSVLTQLQLKMIGLHSVFPGSPIVLQNAARASVLL